MPDRSRRNIKNNSNISLRAGIFCKRPWYHHGETCHRK